MPRLVRQVPKYCLHKGSGQATVTIDKRRIYLGKHGSVESHQRYGEVIAGIPARAEPVPPKRGRPRRTEPTPAAGLLVGQVIARFTKHANTYYRNPTTGKPTGEAQNIAWILRSIAERFGELPADHLGPKRVKDHRDQMAAKGATRYVCNKTVAILRRCFTWAASEEMVKPETAMGLRLIPALRRGRSPAKECEPVRPVSDEHLEQVIGVVSPLVGDVLRVMALTGARPGEICSMTVQEVDRSAADVWIYRPDTHKCAWRGTARSIPLGERVQVILRPRILKPGRKGRLFDITTDALNRSVHRACVRLGIPVFRPNMVRHAFATRVRERFGLEAAQVLLGHSEIATTQIYAERDDRKALEFARAFG